MIPEENVQPDINDLRFVFFTNEKNIDFLSITLKYFLKHSKENEKVSVIVNKINRTDLPYKEKVEYLDANVEFDHLGHHFGKSLEKVIANFEESYLFLFLDDYFLIKDINYNQLSVLMDTIKKQNIDCFSFEFRDAAVMLDTLPFVTDNETLSNKLFMKTNNHRYLYSLQPTIWKRESLLNICKEFSFDLHGMDETLDIIKEKNRYLCTQNSLNSFFNFIDIETNDYYVIAYCELTRHGVFPVSENGFSGSDENIPYIKLIRKIVEEENLTQRKEFSKQLANIR